MGKQFKAWIEAMRLRTLPVSIAGVLTAVGFNIADGTFNAVPATLCLIFALLCQTASNFANEYFDYRAGRDKAGREGPRRGVTEGDITPKSMLHATYALLCLAALIGLSLTYWGGAWLIAVGAAVFIGALAYSAGPYPLSTHCLGEVAVIFFFGLVPVTLTYYLQALSWNWPVVAASLAIGLMGANVLVINNYRDIDDDRATGKHTLATSTPPQTMPALYILNAIAAMLLMLPVWLAMPRAALIVPIAYIVAASIISRKMATLKGRQLNPLLGLTAISMSTYALLFLLINLYLRISSSAHLQ